MIFANQILKNFETKTILKYISLSIEKGTCVNILGPSGSGKSTLIKILAGLIKPTAGTITLQSKNTSMVFQKNALFDSLTVEENLLLPLRNHHSLTLKDKKEKSSTLLKSVALEGTAHLFPSELSGGMQKRLGIARSLMNDPEILFLDEPTAGLDPVTSYDIVELISSLCVAKQLTLVHVTNEITRANQMSQKSFLLINGELFSMSETSNPFVDQFINGKKEGPIRWD